MSAWLVSTEHIDVLVTAGIALGLVAEDDATEFGDMLWQENVASLRYRYGDAETFWQLPEPGWYQFSPRAVEDLFYVAKQAHCYGYQACEHPGWEQSRSAAFIYALEDEIAAKTGVRADQFDTQPAYANSTWGVELLPDGTLFESMDEWSAYLYEFRQREVTT
jgi:hypothetical protein